MKTAINDFTHCVPAYGSGNKFSGMTYFSSLGRLEILVHGPDILHIRYQHQDFPVLPELAGAARLMTEPLDDAKTEEVSWVSEEDADNFYLEISSTGRRKKTTRIIVDKKNGTLAAYRNGVLCHGGMIGTGDTVLPASPVRFITTGPNDPLPVGRFNFALDPHDNFYGLGDKSGVPNRRGRRFAMFNRDSLGYDAETSDPLYKSIPFFLKTNSRKKKMVTGLFFPAGLVNYVDLGRESIFFYSLELSGGPYEYFLFLGEDYKEVLSSYCTVTGLPALPPLYSFGFFGSSMNYADPDDSPRRILEYFANVEKHGIPCEGMYLSSGYLRHGNGKRYAFMWNKQKFPDASGYIGALKERGYHLCMNIKPGILVSHPWYDELAAKGYFLKDAHGNPYKEFFWGGEASLVDFSNPGAAAWWQSQLKEQYLDKGCSGIWNDNNEFELEDKEMSAFKNRSVMPVLMAKASYEIAKKLSPSERPWIYSRSGYSGIQRYARTWSGDNTSTWETLHYNQYQGLGLGLAALPFVGHDLGGFYGDAPEEELLVRSCQGAVFQARFVIHSWRENGQPTEPWTYPGALAKIRHFVQEHYRFMPYIYNSSIESARTGVPLDRPLFLEFPNDSRISDSAVESLFGPSVLKLLAVGKGMKTISTYLPAGASWYYVPEEKLYRGGTVLDALASMDRTLWCARAGSVIPTAPGLSTLSTGFFPLVDFLIFPPDRKQNAVYDYVEDDGKTERAEGNFNEWKISLVPKASGKGGTVRVSPPPHPILHGERTFRFTLPRGFSFSQGGRRSREVPVADLVQGAAWEYSGAYTER